MNWELALTWVALVFSLGWNVHAVYWLRAYERTIADLKRQINNFNHYRGGGK